MLTKNEKKILRYLLAEFNTDHSINQIARDCHLSPHGAHKILKKLETEEILSPKPLANIISYKLRMDSNKSKKILELAFIDKIEGKALYRYNDLKLLKPVVKIAVIFGSYLKKDNPNDLDLLIVIDKTHFKKYKEKLKELKNIISVKIHDILQTKKDIKNNFKKEDKIIKECLLNGLVLWGQEELVEVCSHVFERKD